MVKLVESTNWAPLIGRLFIAFGSIERTTHECIREWAGDTIHKHFSGNTLSRRINLAIDLTESQQATESTKSAFIGSLRLAKELLRTRNLVAHNPLCLVLLQDSLDDPFIEAIAHCTKKDYLSLHNLVEIVQKVEQCSDELIHNFVAFRIERLGIR